MVLISCVLFPRRKNVMAFIYNADINFLFNWESIATGRVNYARNYMGHENCCCTRMCQSKTTSVSLFHITCRRHNIGLFITTVQGRRGGKDIDLVKLSLFFSFLLALRNIISWGHCMYAPQYSNKG